MGIDRTVIERIRSASFPSSWAWRGYDKGEVEKFLEALAAWLEADETHERRRSAAPPDAEPIAKLKTRIEELERRGNDALRRERRLADALKRTKARLRDRAVAADADRASAAGTGGERRTRAAGRRPRGPATGSTPTAHRRSGSRGDREPDAEADRAKYDVNAISFDEVRALGLSIRQGARLITLRADKGGFESLDELEGISESELRRLRANLTVGRNERRGRDG